MRLFVKTIFMLLIFAFMTTRLYAATNQSPSAVEGGQKLSPIVLTNNEASRYEGYEVDGRTSASVLAAQRSHSVSGTDDLILTVSLGGIIIGLLTFLSKLLFTMFNIAPLSSRKALLNLHLYLALSLGVFLVIAGLTGSLLVYGQKLDKWLNSDLMRVNKSGQPLALSELIALANQATPTQSPPVDVILPKETDEALIIRYALKTSSAVGRTQNVTGELQGKKHAHKTQMTSQEVTYNQEQSPPDHMLGHMKREAPHFLEVMVNPYTGQVLGHRDRSDSLMSTLLQIHSRLLLGDTGKFLMGITSLIALVLIFSGIYLWWPNSGKIKQAFTIKQNASFTRFNFDLHKTVGIYSAVVLLVVAFTGLYFNLPFIVRPFVNAFSPIWDLPKEIKSVSDSGDVRTPEAIIQKVKSSYPGIQVQKLSFPKSAQDSFWVTAHQAYEVGSKGATHIWLDQYSGEIIRIREPNQLNAGSAFESLLLPLHNGEFLGSLGSLLVFIVGFTPLTMVITGSIHWLKKRKSKRAYVSHEILQDL